MKILEFAKLIGNLKKTKRAGWTVHKIPHSESVAEHCFRTIVLALVLSKNLKLDHEKVVKTAIIHDIGEALVGDIIKHLGKKTVVNLAQVQKNEEDAIKKIFSLIDGAEYIKLYQEYEEMKTKEARFVRQIDRLEFLIQALEYEQEHKIKLPKVYSDWVNMVMKDKSLKKIVDQIEKLRRKK